MNAYFALSTPQINVDPDVNAIGLVLMGLGVILFVGFVLWRLLPLLVTEYRNRQEEKIQAANSIWFDYKESVLHCGENNMRIEPNSFEYFVCKLTFRTPNKYQPDNDIFDEVDRTKSKSGARGVEQAVRRLNDKGTELGLNSALFKRGKGSTSVNDEYRPRIVKN
jgi:DNA-binding response OmpR family regulator